MKGTNPFAFKFNTMALVLIPVAVGINYVGKLFASVLKLPLWLDSVGTILAAMLAGPWIGAITGLINNIIYGLTIDPGSAFYAITSVAIGLTAGILAYMGWTKNWTLAFLMGLVVALVAAIVSTPLNILLWGGQTGNIWGDLVFAAIIARDLPLLLASFTGELVVDLMDKVATVLVSYIIYRSLPKRFLIAFNNENKTEKF